MIKLEKLGFKSFYAYVIFENHMHMTTQKRKKEERKK